MGGTVRARLAATLDAKRLVVIATDRISAFDVVMPTPIPGKGRLLTALSTFWLKFAAESGIVRTHLLSTSVGDIPGSAFRAGGTTREDLEGRIPLVLDGGPTRRGLESTVVDLSGMGKGGAPEVLREGRGPLSVLGL